MGHDRAELIRSIHHDLSAPVRVIAGFAELLREHRDRLEEADVDRYLAHIDDAAVRLQQMLDAWVELERLELDTGPHRAVDLAQVAREAAAGRAEVEVVVGDLPVVRGDERQLRALVAELLDNALAAGRSGRTVRTVRIEIAVDASGVTARGGTVEITFDDDGDRIPVEERAGALAPFDRFRPGAAPPARLGLPGCRRIAELHGGTLMLDDSPLGGTRVTVTLPVPPAHVEERVAG